MKNYINLMISFNFLTIVQINVKFYLKFMHNYYAIYIYIFENIILRLFTFLCELLKLLCDISMYQSVTQQFVNRKDLLHVLEAVVCTKGQSRNSESSRSPSKVNARALHTV